MTNKPAYPKAPEVVLNCLWCAEPLHDVLHGMSDFCSGTCRSKWYDYNSEPDETWLTAATIRICEEWYRDTIEGDSGATLVERLKQLGEVEHTWDASANIWYDNVWIHPAYADQPTNDDPPGSILNYQFFHVYRLQAAKVDSGRALVRVQIGRIGNTTLLDIRHPGESS